MKISWTWLVPLLLIQACITDLKVVPGHAHNDYENERPLKEALSARMISVEVDVHFIEGKLYVTHDPPAALDDVPTIETLYLEPLKKQVQENGGQVYPGYDGPFYLMIDVKTAAVPTYRKIEEVLMPYRSMLSTVRDGNYQNKAVDVIISGNRALEEMRGEEVRMAFYDGRLSDLGKEIPVNLMPLVSDNFRNHFAWSGRSEIDEEEYEQLKDIVSNVHQQGRKIRLWAAPDHPKAWETLLKAGIDLINTDDPAAFREFYQSRD